MGRVIGSDVTREDDNYLKSQHLFGGSEVGISDNERFTHNYINGVLPY
jgi:hypothetical protein